MIMRRVENSGKHIYHQSRESSRGQLFFQRFFPCLFFFTSIRNSLLTNSSLLNSITTRFSPLVHLNLSMSTTSSKNSILLCIIFPRLDIIPPHVNAIRNFVVDQRRAKGALTMCRQWTWREISLRNWNLRKIYCLFVSLLTSSLASCRCYVVEESIECQQVNE